MATNVAMIPPSHGDNDKSTFSGVSKVELSNSTEMIRVRFHIPYMTRFGQNVAVVGNLNIFGAWDPHKSFPLQYESPGIWTEYEYGEHRTFLIDTLNTPASQQSTPRQQEQLDEREIHPNTVYTILACHDYWRPAVDARNVQTRDLFVRSVLKPLPNYAEQDFKKVSCSKDGVVLTFSLTNARVQTGHSIIVIGNCGVLGNWDVENGLKLTNAHHPQWRGDAAIDKEHGMIEYKYAIVDNQGKLMVIEEGENRQLDLSNVESNTLYVLSDLWFRFSTQWRAAGLAVPIFSLRTNESGGIGEFQDVKLLVDWAEKTMQKVIQILPVNDTNSTGTWRDSYPYAPVSVFALHPIYANMKQIGTLTDPLMQEIMEAKAKELNELEAVDYERVLKLKLAYLKRAYHDQHKLFLASSEFAKFFEENEEWLVPYAVFSYFKELFQTSDYTSWGKFSHLSQQEIWKFASPSSSQYHDIARHYFTQYHCHQQLCDVAAYTRSKGVSIKGDIPIGIYRYSVDAWMYPELFDTSFQMGTPPDAFTKGPLRQQSMTEHNTEGQNWEFPIYCWENHIKEHFQWWRRRLYKMEEYYDLFRIDHVLGFFRIWVIPEGSVTGMMGHFTPTYPITLEELLSRGVTFDMKRYCAPYIRDHVITDLFGPDDFDFAVREYLEQHEDGSYTLKEYVNTQVKVDKLLPTVHDQPAQDFIRNSRRKHALFKLHAEVLLFEVPGSNGTQFHPRFSMGLTHTFADLDQHSKNVLLEMYNDYLWKRQDDLWAEKALEYLPAIEDATTMLVCAEDLGTVPVCAPRVLDSLNITRLIIQRMPLDPSAEVWDLSRTPYLAVVSPSTHDMPTLRMWWELQRGKCERFYRLGLGHRNDPMPYFCEPWVVKEILAQHFWSPSMLAIIPIQDLLGMNGPLRRQDTHAEQINKCENLPYHYWRYRMHLTLEDLLGEQGEAFSNDLRNMIIQSGRATPY